jgi:hypothetical protein
MDRYHIALFIHLLALIVAAGATTVTKLAASRRERARTVAEVLDWHSVLTSTARLFPICLAAFVLTGSYMLSVANMHVWSSGFVVAGFVGVALLFASGTFLGIKGTALKRMLEELATQGPEWPAPKLVPPSLVATLPAVNTGIALAVVFDMVTKLASVPVALGIIALGAALSAAVVLRGSARRSAGARGVELVDT